MVRGQKWTAIRSSRFSSLCAVQGDSRVHLRKAPPQNMSHPSSHPLFSLPTSSTLICHEAIFAPYLALSEQSWLQFRLTASKHAHTIPCSVDDIALITDILLLVRTRRHTPRSGHLIGSHCTFARERDMQFAAHLCPAAISAMLA